MTMSFMLYSPIFSFVFVRCYYISWRFFSVCVFFFYFVSFLWFFSLKALVSSLLVARFFIHGERFDAGRLCIWALSVNSLWILLYCCDSPVYKMWYEWNMYATETTSWKSEWTRIYLSSVAQIGIDFRNSEQNIRVKAQKKESHIII